MVRILLVLSALILTLTGCGAQKDTPPEIIDMSEGFSVEESSVETPTPTATPVLQELASEPDHISSTTQVDNLDFVGLEMIQAEGDDASIIEALQPYYTDTNDGVTITLVKWDNDNYYLEDSINLIEWKMNRKTFEVTEGWD